MQQVADEKRRVAQAIITGGFFDGETSEEERRAFLISLIRQHSSSDPLPPPPRRPLAQGPTEKGEEGEIEGGDDVTMTVATTEGGEIETLDSDLDDLIRERQRDGPDPPPSDPPIISSATTTSQLQGGGGGSRCLTLEECKGLIEHAREEGRVKDKDEGKIFGRGMRGVTQASIVLAKVPPPAPPPAPPLATGLALIYAAPSERMNPMAARRENKSAAPLDVKAGPDANGPTSKKQKIGSTIGGEEHGIVGGEEQGIMKVAMETTLVPEMDVMVTSLDAVDNLVQDQQPFEKETRMDEDACTEEPALSLEQQPTADKIEIEPKLVLEEVPPVAPRITQGEIFHDGVGTTRQKKGIVGGMFGGKDEEKGLQMLADIRGSRKRKRKAPIAPDVENKEDEPGEKKGKAPRND